MIWRSGARKRQYGCTLRTMEVIRAVSARPGRSCPAAVCLRRRWVLKIGRETKVRAVGEGWAKHKTVSVGRSLWEIRKALYERLPCVDCFRSCVMRARDWSWEQMHLTAQHSRGCRCAIHKSHISLLPFDSRYLARSFEGSEPRVMRESLLQKSSCCMCTSQN